MFVGKQTHVHRVDREICDYFGLDVMKEYVIVATEMFRMQKSNPVIAIYLQMSTTLFIDV